MTHPAATALALEEALESVSAVGWGVAVGALGSLVDSVD